MSALYQDTTREVIRSIILSRCALPSKIPLRECRTEANLEKENDHHRFFRYENDRWVEQRCFAAQPGKVSLTRKIGTPPRLVILRLIHNVQGGEKDRGETPQSQAERKAFRSSSDLSIREGKQVVILEERGRGACPLPAQRTAFID